MSILNLERMNHNRIENIKRGIKKDINMSRKSSESDFYEKEIITMRAMRMAGIRDI